jgi:hypothetical protein
MRVLRHNDWNVTEIESDENIYKYILTRLPTHCSYDGVEEKRGKGGDT